MIKIKYKAWVYCYHPAHVYKAPWRPGEITAIAEKISDKKAKIIRIIDIKDHTKDYNNKAEKINYNHSLEWMTSNQKDVVKLLSKCISIEEIKD